MAPLQFLAAPKVDGEKESKVLESILLDPEIETVQLLVHKFRTESRLVTFVRQSDFSKDEQTNLASHRSIATNQFD